MTYRTPAIVCDAGKLSQVAIIQELGRIGIPVVAIDGSPGAMGFASRYVEQRILCPVPSYEEEYVCFLLAKAPRGVIFYSNDANTENIARVPEELLRAGFHLVIADRTTLGRVIQKDRLYQTASECGVSVPACCLVSSACELEEKVGEFGLPLILKSTNLAGGIYQFVRSREEVPAVFRAMTQVIDGTELRHRSARLMAQEWISQRNVELWNFSACVREGEILSFSMGRRVRTNLHEDGTIGSILLYGRTAFHAEIFQQNRRILSHLGFSGLVETEWSQDTAENGRIYLYDFNPRPSGNIHWALKSGADLVEQYYRLSLGLPVERHAMREGVVYAKVVYPQNDWLEALFEPGRTLAGKLAVFRDDLIAVAGCGRHAVDVLNLRDPWPSVRALGETLAHLRERAALRIARRHHDDTAAEKKRDLPVALPQR
jgi:predicted ATP-grasp superfamily ATP-dependent carboligase